MNKVPSCLITFLIFYRQEYLVAPQMTESQGRKNTAFSCENENGIGERVGDNKTRLLYYTYESRFSVPKHKKACALNHSPRIESLNLIAVELSTENEEFVISILNKTSMWLPAENDISQIAITSNGPRQDTFYTLGNFDFVQQTRMTCAGVWNITRKIGVNIRTPVVDWVTSNVYFISDSRIMVCDHNFFICTTLPSANKIDDTETFFLTISPERRLLFSVFKINWNGKYKLQILAQYLDNVLKPSSLVKNNLVNPKWITVDPIQERLYWLDGFEHTLSLYSSDFKGKNLKKSQCSDSMLDNSHFAAFNNIIYWLNEDQKKIMKCFVDNCTDSASIFKEVIGKTHHCSRTELGYPIIDYIDYHSLNSINHLDPCNVSLCSHLCLPESETKYRCYCQHLEDPISLSDKNNGFCEDYTLLAVYKDILYVVGLPNDNFSTPKIREHKINVGSIAAVTYDSINGNVILTEVGQQKIYLWLPRTKELKLISDEGYGTIKSLAFDHYTNNLYWINPSVQVIKAVNLRTGSKVNILEGNSSYIPMQFVLIPSTGYMSVLFLMENSSITIEYGIAMDGLSNTRQILLWQDEIKYNVEDLTLYYSKENQTICLLNRWDNTISYFSAQNSQEVLHLRRKEAMSEIVSLAFLKNSIVWSEKSLVIQKAQVGLLDLLVSRPRVPKISLVHPSRTSDLDNANNSVFRLFGIERQIEIPDHAAKCLENNGGCEELEMCLVSPGYLQVSCVCPEGEELTSNKSCRRTKQLQSTKSEMDMSMTETSSEPLTQSEIGPMDSVAYKVRCLMFILISLAVVSFVGYLSVRTFRSLKKRTGRSSQRRELLSASYCSTGRQFSSSYPRDEEYY